jgi:L-aminopeptidase/D-esterase-like protein
VLTEIEGVRVGHWTDARAMTGCTVVLLPAGTVASGEVRGGSPATREFALLDPHRSVALMNAVVLTGGSAFGLAAADGVMRFCEERGIGFATRAGVVPIVVAMGLYDLAVGDPAVRPGPAEGVAACEAASDGPVEVGAVGAGTGATFGVWPDGTERRAGGLGGAVERHGDLVVAALVAVNAFGGPFTDTLARIPPAPPTDPTCVAQSEIPDSATQVRREGDPNPRSSDPEHPTCVAQFHMPNSATQVGKEEGDEGDADGLNTTIGVVATNAGLTKIECSIVAQSAHDGLARALKPAHSRVDGDAFVVAATGRVAAGPTTVDVVRELAAAAVESAIRRVVAPQ